MAMFDEFAGGYSRSLSVTPDPAFHPRRGEGVARTIESEIVPRLMMLHAGADGCGPDMPPTPAEVARFVQILLDGESAVAEGFVAAARANGASHETLLLRLFAPAARMMGDLWREDLASFAEVTIGLSQLQRMLRTLTGPYENRTIAASNGRSVLLVPTPGEQHSFGLSVVESMLRRAGWDVEMAWGASEASLTEAVRQESYDVIGLSLSCDLLLERLGSTIDTLRRRSRNQAVKVIVGGRFFVSHPHMVAHVGADAAALDANDAVVQAGSLAGLPAPLDW